MGISRRELQIIDRWEAGRPASAIAEELGLGVGYVTARVSSLCINVGSTDSHERAMERGSRKLLVAIEQARAA